MPAESRHHVTGSLTVALGLALTAGYVDAFVYQNVMPVFVANMSGNLVKFGMSLGAVDSHATVAAAAALAAFSLAAVAGATLIDRRVSNGALADPAPLLFVEVLLLTMLTVVAVVTDTGHSDELSGPHLAIVLFGAAAMGLQAVSLRRVGEVAVSTTYGTGAIVRLSEKLALGLRRAPNGHGVPRRHSVMVLSSILVAYVAGAAIATAIAEHRGVLAIVPAATLLLASRTHHISVKRQ